MQEEEEKTSLAVGLTLSIFNYCHICFSFDWFVCPSVFVFLPPPPLSPSVSGGRLRNDPSGFDAAGPCPCFLQHMSNGNNRRALNQLRLLCNTPVSAEGIGERAMFMILLSILQTCLPVKLGSAALSLKRSSWAETEMKTKMSGCCITHVVDRKFFGFERDQDFGGLERLLSLYPQQSLDKTLQRK